MSEISRRWSVYNYAEDNPVRFIDPDGMYVSQFQKSDAEEYEALVQKEKDSKLQRIQEAKNNATGDDGGKNKKQVTPANSYKFDPHAPIQQGPAGSVPTQEKKKPELTGEKEGVTKATDAAKTGMDVLYNTAMKSIELGGKYGGVKAVESFGAKASTTLAGAAIVLTAVDAAANGLQLKHTIDAGLTVISFAQPELAPVIFLANLACMAFNGGKGISETIQNAVKNQDYPTQYSKPAF